MLVGPYEVERELGRGSMGAVYLAHRPGIERALAVKVMNRDALSDQEAVVRFKQEARLASRIDHPGIVPVIDVGEHEGVPYYVMEFCAGETLKARLHRGPLAPLEAARVVRELADAVAAAHAAGCIHRDLKPANVLIDDRGRARITDFGLARDEASRHRLTRTGDILGTPAYMAPEQVRGEKNADARIDVYGLGVILYECLSASRPFTGESSAIIAKNILQGRPTPIRAVRADVPSRLAAVVEKAIANDRSARFESAAAMRDALDAFLDQGETPELSRFVVRLTAFTFLLAIGVGVGGFFLLRARSAADEARRAEAAHQEELRIEAEKKAAAEKAARERAAREEEEQRRREHPDLNGRWKGYYPGNGPEIIEVRQEGDSVVATKVTGDDHVPAGEVTWRATLDGMDGPGEGQVAGLGHRYASFVPGKLKVLDEDRIEFTWGTTGPGVVFTRQK